MDKLGSKLLAARAYVDSSHLTDVQMLSHEHTHNDYVEERQNEHGRKFEFGREK
jgi:hypothetical protein